MPRVRLLALALLASISFSFNSSLAQTEEESNIKSKIDDLENKMKELEAKRQQITAESNAEVDKIYEKSNKQVLEVVRKEENTKRVLKGLKNISLSVIEIKGTKSETHQDKQLERKLETRIAAAGLRALPSKSSAAIDKQPALLQFLTTTIGDKVTAKAQLFEFVKLVRTPGTVFNTAVWEINDLTARASSDKAAAEQLINQMVAEFVFEYKKSNNKK